MEDRIINTSQPASELVYELPLNERLRTFLRLETLFSETDHHLCGDKEIDTRAAVRALLSIMMIFSRPELKTEFLKEMDRLCTSLSKYSEVDGVDISRLSNIREELTIVARNLRNLDGQIAASLKHNEFLNAIKQRESVPGGAMAFDTPMYAHWLRQSCDYKTEQIRLWLQEFEYVRQALTLSLSLIRSAGEFKTNLAKNGTYSEALDTSIPYQMIRINVASNLAVFPEISGGRHRFTVRFLELKGTDRPTLVEIDVPFEVTCCAL